MRNIEQVHLIHCIDLMTVFRLDPENDDYNFLYMDRKICNFYGSTEMSDVTFAVFRSVEDLLEQMDDQNKVILCNKKIFAHQNIISIALEKRVVKIKY